MTPFPPADVDLEAISAELESAECRAAARKGNQKLADSQILARVRAFTTPTPPAERVLPFTDRRKRDLGPPPGVGERRNRA